MIEMHQEGEPLGGEGGAGEDEDYPPYQASRTGWIGLALSAPSLALASLLLSFAVLTTVQSAVEIGETVFLNRGNAGDNLTALRTSAIVRLVLGAVGLLLAVMAAVQVHDDEDLGEEDQDLALPGDPLWVRGLTGAALLVSVASVVLSAVALIFTLHAHDNFGAGGV